MTHPPTHDALVKAAERYCATAGIKLSTLGLYAVQNSRLFASLKAGRPCLTSTMDRVQAYMASNPPPTNSPDQEPLEQAPETMLNGGLPQVAAE